MKILQIDIETAPNTAYVWGLFKENVPISRIVNSGYVLCFAAKWYGEKGVMFHKHTDKDFLDVLWDLLDAADAVIHYNGKKFDIPTINKEFVVNGYLPPSPYKQLDLYHTVRREFRFTSNKLDYVAEALGIGKKHAHEGFELWVKCMNNDKAAWKNMEKYNKQDVVLLEALYDHLRPWMDRHPNMALYVDSDNPVCPACGSEHVTKQGTRKTTTRVYQQWRCGDCGKWSRSRLSDLEQSRKVQLV